MPSRVIQVSQPLAIRRKLAADAAWRAVLPLLLVAPFMAAAAWWLTALALRPLQRVAAGVRQRDEQSLAAAAQRPACPTRWRRWSRR